MKDKRGWSDTLCHTKISKEALVRAQALCCLIFSRLWKGRTRRCPRLAGEKVS